MNIKIVPKSRAIRANVERIIRNHPLTDNEKNLTYITKLRDKNAKAWPLEDYVLAKTKIKHVYFNCGHIAEVVPCRILTGSGCDYCNRKFTVSKRLRKTQEQYEKELAELSPELKVIGEYTNAKDRILIRCGVCGYEWRPEASSLLHNKTKCPKCAKNARLTQDEFVERVESHNKLKVLGDYINQTRKVLVQCIKCQEEFYIYPESAMHGSGCLKCGYLLTGKGMTKSNNKFLDQLKKLNVDFVPVESYTKGNVPMEFCCNTCGNIFKYTPARILAGATCPFCNKKISKGEQAIMRFLRDYNIKYVRQKTYPKLTGGSSRPLLYDFYLPDYNLLIEYQGEQHQYPVDRFGGIESFNVQKKNDQKKRDYANMHNIRLLEIWYWDYKNIESILTKHLKLESVETVTVA